MVKRNRDTEYNYEPTRRVRPRIDFPPIAPSYALPMITGRGRSYRKSAGSSKRSKPYRRYTRRYLGPKNRGPYARVNRSAPELKSREIDTQYIPISYGNMTIGATLTWGGTTPFPAANWTGNLNSGYTRCLNLLGTGTDIDQRIGRRVLNKSILLNMTWRLPDPVGDPLMGYPPPSPVAIRTILVWDYQPNGVNIVISDFLKPVLNQSATSVPAVTSPNNLNNRDRFRTLWDCRDTLSPGGDSLRTYEKYIKINRETTFSDGSTSADIGSVSTGALYLILLSDVFDYNSGNSSYIYYRPVCSYSSRFRFVDA